MFANQIIRGNNRKFSKSRININRELQILHNLCFFKCNDVITLFGVNQVFMDMNTLRNI